MRFFRCIAFPLLSVSMGLACATTQPELEAPLPEPAPAVPLASPPPTMPPPGAPSAGGASALDDPNALVRLCESMRDEDSMSFSGTAVAQAQARDEHARRRQAAETGRFVAMIPSQGFHFGEYDLPARRLLLNTARGFALGEGVELAPNDTSSIGFVLPPETADHMLVSRASGNLYLRVVFRPARSKLRNETCLWMSGGRVVKLGIELEAVALLGADGSRLARADMAESGAEIDTPVARPQVLVRRPRSADGREVPHAMAEAVSGLAATVLPCYQKALQDQPNLRGTLVLALSISADGKVDESRMEISSLGNDRLTSCAAAHVGQARLSGDGIPQKLSVSLVFGSKDDR